MIRVVDGGHLAWTYGVFVQNSWSEVKYGYRNAIVCMDSSNSWRREQAPEYKARRALKRLTHEEVAVKKARVDEFRQLLLQDPTLNICMVDGMEADDLVALHYMEAAARGDEVSVYAVDKDLIQVPGLWQHMHRLDGERAHTDLKRYPKSAPAYWPGARHESDVLLAQALFGDRSDSIPRLLPRYDRTTARRVWESNKPFKALWYLFGTDLIRSLYQLIIPSVKLRWDVATILQDPEYLIHMLDTRSYYEPEMFTHDCKRDIPALTW